MGVLLRADGSVQGDRRAGKEVTCCIIRQARRGTAVDVHLVDLDLTKTCLDRERIPEGVCLVRITAWLSEYVIRGEALAAITALGLQHPNLSPHPIAPHEG